MNDDALEHLQMASRGLMLALQRIDDSMADPRLTEEHRILLKEAARAIAYQDDVLDEIIDDLVGSL